MEKDNILINEEKPYYTEEEMKLYYAIAIDEARKQGNDGLAEHYQILLDYLNRDKTNDELSNMIANKRNK